MDDMTTLMIRINLDVTIEASHLYANDCIQGRSLRRGWGNCLLTHPKKSFCCFCSKKLPTTAMLNHSYKFMIKN